HLVAGPQMLEAMVDDGSHALGYRLVLGLDADDPGINPAVLLRLPVDQPVVTLIAGEPPSAEPVGRVRHEIHRELRAGEVPSVAERGARGRQVLPGQADEHGM